jgi:hypothetical protein
MNENVTDPEHWLEFRIIVVAILEKVIKNYLQSNFERA